MPGFAIAGSRLQGHPWPWAAASLKSNSPCDCHLCVTCHSVSGPLPLAARKPKAKWCLAVGPVFFQFLAASAMEDLSCSSLCRCFPRSSRIYEPALQDMSFHRRSTLSSRTVPKYQDGLEWTCSQRHHERSSLLVGGWTTTNININIYMYIYIYCDAYAIADIPLWCAGLQLSSRPAERSWDVSWRSNRTGSCWHPRRSFGPCAVAVSLALGSLGLLTFAGGCV